MASPLRIHIHPAAGPPYEQLRDGIRRRIERGTLEPGDRLPPVRACAESHDLAPNTVARAYRELEDAGWLVGRGRAGTFVVDDLPEPEDPSKALMAAAVAYLRRVSQLGFGREDARRAIDNLR